MLRAIGDDEMPDYTGKRVVVIGGGNVAMDVARSSVRLGAEKVSIVYRRRKADMTALPEEVEGAEAEGCDVLELMSPVRIEKDENDAAVGLWVQPQMISGVDTVSVLKVEVANHQQYVEMICRLFEVYTFLPFIPIHQ